MGIVSLILGIISLVIGCFFRAYGWLGAIFALIGIILGAVGRKNPERKGVATGGLVCSIIGFILCIIMYVIIAVVAGSLASLY